MKEMKKHNPKYQFEYFSNLLILSLQCINQIFQLPPLLVAAVIRCCRDNRRPSWFDGRLGAGIIPGTNVI